MNYATIKYYDIANGPGVRTSVFVSGCRHHCPGCFNAVAWDFDYGEPFTEAVMALKIPAGSANIIMPMLITMSRIQIIPISGIPPRAAQSVTGAGLSFNNILKYFQIYPVRRTKKLLKGCKNMI